MSTTTTSSKRGGRRRPGGEGNLSAALEQNKTRTVAHHENGAQLGKSCSPHATTDQQRRFRASCGFGSASLAGRTARCQKPRRRRSVRACACARSRRRSLARAAEEGHSSRFARSHTQSGSKTPLDMTSTRHTRSRNSVSHAPSCGSTKSLQNGLDLAVCLVWLFSHRNKGGKKSFFPLAKRRA